MDQSNKSVTKALEYLHSLIGNTGYSEGSRLPTTVDLAMSAHVSPNAMCRAVGILKKKKLISVSRKSGIFIGPERKVVREPRLNKWQKIRARIEQDIIAGRFFTSDELPSMRELMKLYGVSFQLIRKVAGALASEGVIERYKGKFKIKKPEASHRYASILLAGPGFPSGKMSFYQERFRDANHQMEKDCNAANITFVHWGLHPENHEEFYRLLKSGRNFIGYVVWSNRLGPDEARELVETISKSGKPVAIIDEQVDFVLPESLRDEAHIRIFSIAGRSAGRQVVRLLFNLGHRHIAYVSPFHKHPWSVYRLAGMTETARDVGFDSAVSALTVDSFDAESAPLGDALKEKIASLTREFDPLIIRQTERFVPIVNGIHDFTRDVFFIEATRQRVWPLLEQVLARHPVTAWIGANDNIATLAIDYLRREGKRIPRDMAVVGFDDSHLAYEYDMTSYNFDFSGIGRKAFTFIIHPAHRYFQQGGQRIECEGIIVERASTGRRSLR
jgi:DNA-binding LacI/PurR family transcriptional regulator/DNA-binding transcriptional regulator YhcF (GntR family)